MRRIVILALLSLATLSCAGRKGVEDVRFPIIRYNPSTYLSDIEGAFENSPSCKYLRADSELLSDVDKEVVAYLSGQDAFLIYLSDDDARRTPKFIGIRDKEGGYLKYLDLEEEKFCYSLDKVIGDMYGSLEEYIATWHEGQRHLFYDDPQGLYTFPIELYAVTVVGYGNSADPENPVKYKAAITFLRSSRPEWNDGIWAADSAEIVKHSKSVAGAFLHFPNVGRARFENDDANYFSKWINERLTYPDEALESATTGRVTSQFTIDMFGNLEDVKILRGRHPALDSVVLNVLSSSSAKWAPATDQVGNPHSVTYTFPVIFTPEMMLKAFITKMYNEKLYDDYDFLQKHCSPELLKRLQDAYTYDADGPAYATWLFRSGQQDSKPGSDGKTMMLDVNADGDWYVYTALDMGWKVTNRIKVTSKDSKIIIEDMDLTGEWAKAFVRNSYLYHWHKTQDVDSTVMAFCDLAKHLMPDIQLDLSAIKAYIMSAEKENAVEGEGEDLLNIVTAGKYYTPLCRCDIYPYMKEQMSEDTLATFYNVYDSWKTDLKIALRAIKDKCYREISIELYGNDHDIIGNREIVKYLIKTEK